MLYRKLIFQGYGISNMTNNIYSIYEIYIRKIKFSKGIIFRMRSRTPAIILKKIILSHESKMIEY